MGGRPKITLPDPPPPGPTLAETLVRNQGAEMATAQSGRRGSFLTGSMGGASAPAPKTALAARSPEERAWDYRLEGDPNDAWGSLGRRIIARRQRQQGTY